MNEDYRSKDVEAEMDETPSMEFNPRNFFKSFYHTSKAVLLSPKVFFAAMKKGGDFRGPFLYMAACVLFHVVIFGLLQKDPEIMLKTFFLGILFPFITAGILFGIVKRVFRAEGSYESAFRVNAYASAVNLVAWLPLVGLFFELYRVYLIVIGLSGAFSIRPSRSLLAVLITMAVYIMVSAALAYL